MEGVIYRAFQKQANVKVVHSIGSRNFESVWIFSRPRAGAAFPTEFTAD